MIVSARNCTLKNLKDNEVCELCDYDDSSESGKLYHFIHNVKTGERRLIENKKVKPEGDN